MYLPYDIFNHFIDITLNNDFNTLINLCYVDKEIEKMCLLRPFTKVLLQFKFNEFYNPTIKSEILTEFLNDISGNDVEFLKEIQLVFGSCLTGKNLMNKAILLQGNCNGKSTFLILLRKILGSLYQAVRPGVSDLQTLKYTSVVSLSETDISNAVPLVKRLLGKDEIYTKYGNIKVNPNIIFHQNDDYGYEDLGRIKKIKFRTRYVEFVNFHNQKLMCRFYTDKIYNNRDASSALLTFLLIGCRDVLNNPTLLS